MPFARSWQRDLDRDPGSEVVQIARRQETHPEPIDIEEFCRAFLDGAIGDEGPFATQDEALAACELALVRRAGRALNKSESVKLGMTLALAWNRRRASLEALAQGHEDGIRVGRLCSECGAEFHDETGSPRLCDRCGSAAAAVGSTISWYAGERYYANAYDAEIERRRAAEKAARYQARIAAYEQRQLQQPARGAKLAIAGAPQTRGVYWGPAHRSGAPTLFAIDSTGNRVAEVAFGPSVEAVDAIEGIWNLLDSINPIDLAPEAA